MAKDNNNALGALVAGMAIGAAAMALSKKENREIVKEKAQKAKTKINEMTEKGKANLNSLIKETEHEMEETKDKIETIDKNRKGRNNGETE